MKYALYNTGTDKVIETHSTKESAESALAERDTGLANEGIEPCHDSVKRGDELFIPKPFRYN